MEHGINKGRPYLGADTALKRARRMAVDAEYSAIVRMDAQRNSWRYAEPDMYVPTPEHDAQRQRIDDVIKNL